MWINIETILNQHLFPHLKCVTFFDLITVVIHHQKCHVKGSFQKIISHNLDKTYCLWKQANTKTPVLKHTKKSIVKKYVSITDRLNGYLNFEVFLSCSGIWSPTSKIRGCINLAFTTLWIVSVVLKTVIGSNVSHALCSKGLKMTIICNDTPLEIFIPKCYTGLQLIDNIYLLILFHNSILNLYLY